MSEPKPQHKESESTTYAACRYFMDMALKALCAAKIFPVAYSLVLIILIICYGNMSQGCASLIGTTAFVTLPFTILCIWLSYPLHLCNWYRFHALMMLSPLAIPLTHAFAPEFDLRLVRWIVGGLLAVTTCVCICLFLTPKKPKQTITTNK